VQFEAEGRPPAARATTPGPRWPPGPFMTSRGACGIVAVSWRSRSMRCVSGGRDVGLGVGVAGLIFGDLLTPGPGFCCRRCGGL